MVLVVGDASQLRRRKHQPWPATAAAQIRSTAIARSQVSAATCKQPTDRTAAAAAGAGLDEQGGSGRRRGALFRAHRRRARWQAAAQRPAQVCWELLVRDNSRSHGVAIGARAGARRPARQAGRPASGPRGTAAAGRAPHLPERWRRRRRCSHAARRRLVATAGPSQRHRRADGAAEPTWMIGAGAARPQFLAIDP